MVFPMGLFCRCSCRRNSTPTFRPTGARFVRIAPRKMFTVFASSSDDTLPSKHETRLQRSTLIGSTYVFSNTLLAILHLSLVFMFVYFLKSVSSSFHWKCNLTGRASVRSSLTSLSAIFWYLHTGRASVRSSLTSRSAILWYLHTGWYVQSAFVRHWSLNLIQIWYLYCIKHIKQFQCVQREVLHRTW
jgi:hypothetical protein